MKSYKQSAFFPLLLIGLLQITMLAALFLSSIGYAATPQPPTAQASPDLATALSALVAQADMVVRAQVVQSTSHWNSNRTQIETDHKLVVRYTLVGESKPDLLVRTDGGFLPAEDIGMRSSHTPSFAPGEEVLVFLQKAASSYRVVQDEAGKFAVFNAEAVSAYYRSHLALDQVATTIQAAAHRQGKRATLPVDWRTYEATVSPRLVNPAQQPMADPKWPGATPKIKVKVNLNSSHIGDQGGTAEEFLAAIQNVLRTWSVVAEAEFTLLYDGPTSSTTTGFNSANEIIFMAQGTNSPLGKAMVWYTSNGAILEADVWINEDYQIDATDDPMTNEIDLESIVLHEVGHWLPLGHVNVPAAVMYAVLGTGIRKRVLSSEDIAGIAALYPCAAVPCIDPAYTDSNTPTPTMTATGSITNTATETSTPTITPTIDPSAPTGTPTATPTESVTPTPTIIPSAVTPSPPSNVFLPLVTK